MKEKEPKDRDELTELMHSEFAISPEREKAIKVMLAKESMKDFNYSIAQVCELYELNEDDFGDGDEKK